MIAKARAKATDETSAETPKFYSETEFTHPVEVTASAPFLRSSNFVVEMTSSVDPQSQQTKKSTQI